MDERTICRLDSLALLLPQADLVDDRRRQDCFLLPHLGVRPRGQVGDDLVDARQSTVKGAGTLDAPGSP